MWVVVGWDCLVSVQIRLLISNGCCLDIGMLLWVFLVSMSFMSVFWWMVNGVMLKWELSTLSEMICWLLGFWIMFYSW